MNPNIKVFEDLLDCWSQEYLQESEKNLIDAIQLHDNYCGKSIHIKSIVEAYNWYLDGKDVILIKAYLEKAPYINWPFKKSVIVPPIKASFTKIPGTYTF